MSLKKCSTGNLVEAAKPALDDGEPVQDKFIIRNTDRTTGALLSNEISKKYKGKGLPEDTIHFQFKGSAGQSFGAFVAPGVTFELEGDANDYFGKGLSGGKLIVYPDKEATFNQKIISSLVTLLFMEQLPVKHTSVVRQVNVSAFVTQV